MSFKEKQLMENVQNVNRPTLPAFLGSEAADLVSVDLTELDLLQPDLGEPQLNEQPPKPAQLMQFNALGGDDQLGIEFLNGALFPED